MVSASRLFAFVAALSVQQHNPADVRRDAAELEAAARTFDPGALAAAAKAAEAASTRMARCERLATQHAALTAASQARWEKIVARNPLKHAGLILSDHMTEETMTPDGIRRTALWRDYRACMTEGASALPEPARTCARLDQPIDDLTLKQEQRWIAFRGPVPAVFHDKAEVSAFDDRWKKQRQAFLRSDSMHPDTLKLDALTVERRRACTGGPVPAGAAAEPDW